jgi:hypothetical protein
MGDFDERVRERAYRLWVEEGCPDGRSEAHWDMARELVAIEQNQKLATRPLREPEESGEPVEPIEALRNAGEFPTLTDQGEQSPPRRRDAAPSLRPPRRNTAAESKPARNGAGKRR